MNVRLRALAAALFACTVPAWASIEPLPTHETYSATALDATYTPLLDVTISPGVTAQISGTDYSASASTTLGSNHAYAQASAFPADTFGSTSFSGWYDQVTINGGEGAGTAQFTVQLSGSVDVGAFAGIVGYGLMTSSTHPSVLGTDIIVDPGTPTSPWFLISSEVNPIIEYSIVASPYDDPDQLSGLFGPPVEESPRLMIPPIFLAVTRAWDSLPRTWFSLPARDTSTSPFTARSTSSTAKRSI